MKNKLLLITLLLCFFAKAQNNDYANRIEHIFENINPSKVTTGFLKDYGISLVDIEKANGVLSNENQVNRSQFVSIHNSLYTMRIGNTVSDFIDPAAFTNTLNNATTSNDVDVVLATQHYNYQQYKENAYINGDVNVVDDQIFDINGRNPYEIKTLVAAAALTQKVKGDTFSFLLPSNLMFSFNQLSPT
ncbi:MAG: hypothetical protein ACI9YE_001991 [Psychroserpens sp.]|jgi:hypothetical protein